MHWSLRNHGEVDGTKIKILHVFLVLGIRLYNLFVILWAILGCFWFDSRLRRYWKCSCFWSLEALCHQHFEKETKILNKKQLFELPCILGHKNKNKNKDFRRRWDSSQMIFFASTWTSKGSKARHQTHFERHSRREDEFHLYYNKESLSS